MNRDDATKLLTEVEANRVTRERFDARADFWAGWLQRRREDEADGDEDTLEADDVTALACVALEDWVHQHLVIQRDEAGAESAELRSQLSDLRAELASDAQRTMNQMAALRDRTADLEEQARQRDATLADMGRAMGELQRELSKERAMRRLMESRRLRPHDQKIAAELSRRAAERAAEENENYATDTLDPETESLRRRAVPVGFDNLSEGERWRLENGELEERSRRSREQRQNVAGRELMKAGFRPGDNAAMAVIEFVDRDVEATGARRSPQRRRERSL